MGKWIFAVVALAFGMVAVASADDVYRVYNFGSGALYGAANDSYSGGAVPGMRFGDAPQVGGNAEVGGGFCQTCYGVAPHPCDPCWRGPCMDWKLIGWYSNWRDPHGCHRKRCCASVGDGGTNCEGGSCGLTDSGGGACVTCNK